MSLPMRGRRILGTLVLTGAVSALLAVANVPALAQDPALTPDELDARIVAAARLPRVANEARTAGIPESELGAALESCKSHRLDAGEAAPALAAATVAVRTAPGTVKIATILDAELGRGLRGDTLIEAIEGVEAPPVPAPRPDAVDDHDDDHDSDDHDDDHDDDDHDDEHGDDGHDSEHGKSKPGKSKHGKSKHHDGSKHGKSEHHDPKPKKSKSGKHEPKHEPKLGATEHEGKGHHGKKAGARPGKAKR